MMGITDNSNDPYKFECVRKELNCIENFLDKSVDNKDTEMAIESVSPSGKGRKSKKSRFFFMDRSIRAKKKGVRQARRTENTNFLLTFSEQDEPDVADADYVDLMEHGLTPFATLFVQQEKMKIWNDFVNQSEDDQRETLQGHGDHDSEPDRDSSSDRHRADSTDSWVVVDDDKRIVHPSYSADQCFQRIEHKLRSMLCRRHLPLGILLGLEEEILSFFVEWPQSVFISHLESSFDRLLLHALCQYLDLYSTSFNDENGLRQTQVENQRTEFVLPPMTLSNYIEYRSPRH